MFRETRLEIENPIIIQGTKLQKQIQGNWMTKEKWNKAPKDSRVNFEKNLLPSTIILGLDENDKSAECEATLTVDVDKELEKNVRKNLQSVTLVIESVRLQAGLHAVTVYDKNGLPYTINSEPKAEVTISTNQKAPFFHDVLDNVSKMPHGKDLGFGSIVEFKLDSFIEDLKQYSNWTITLKVSKDVYWDIDFLRWELTTANKRYRSWVYAFGGIVLGAVLGWLPNIITWLQK
jgi:hypothetical protein